MRPTIVMVMLLPLLPGCGGDPEAVAAMRTLDAFQAALRTHDEPGCRALLTRESAAALQQVPWQQVAAAAPLQVLGAERRSLGYRVQVADPNHAGRHGEFVVVRENGRLVVDLVATAGLTATTSEAGAAPDVFVPRELTPADFDRIRQRELARPPR
ncbi:MAG: hypothetical protein JNN13_16335 [Planctomycetes bacterium]|nr:hypothetical protein [Planctomycetota bacterium]